MNLDKIHLSQGLGNLTFGMTKSTVIGILGDKYTESTDEDRDIEFEYEELALQCTFWKNYDYRLGIISIERRTATLLGERLLGKNKEMIRDFITKKLKCEISEEKGCEHEDGHIQEWIDVNEKNVTFWFRDDELYLIDCFCDWTDTDTPLWPLKEA